MTVYNRLSCTFPLAGPFHFIGLKPDVPGLTG
jgi:hypothetical protein